MARYLISDSHRDSVVKIMEKAASLGYNGIVLGGYGENQYRAEDPDPSKESAMKYNSEFVAQRARELGLDLIPYCFSQNLAIQAGEDIAEAFPVKNTRFLVSNGIAKVYMDPVVTMPNGDFEEWDPDKPNQPLNWRGQSSLMFRDDSVKFSGESSIRMQGIELLGLDQYAIISEEPISVEPYRAYELSMHVKTEGFDTNQAYMNFHVLGHNNVVLQENGQYYKTGEDWNQIIRYIDTFEANRITIYLRVKLVGTNSGTVWLDNATIREVGLAETVRRDSLPIIVESSDGSIVYEEGRDYLVEDEQLIIPWGSTISEGEFLTISWHQLAHMSIHGAAANVCYNEYYDVIESTAQRIDGLFDSPDGFFMNIDEWRYFNWDPYCGTIYDESLAGEYIAYSTRRTEALLRQIAPGAELYVWSDMFDPYHAAVEISRTPVNGSIVGSWEGLSPDTTILNWNFARNIDPETNEPRSWGSWKFFSNRGHRQLFLFHHANFDTEEWVLDSLNEIESQPDGIGGIDGFMYVTWRLSDSDYDNLEAMADIVKASGRWGPMASDLLIIPELPSTADDLSGTYTYIDSPDSSENGSEIRWYRNGVLQVAYNDVLTVPYSATAEGEEWYFTVRPCDGKYYGEVQTSPEYQILYEFSIQLESGWNLISIPVELVDTSREVVLQPIDGLYKSIWAYDLIAGWTKYIVDGPHYLNTLTNIVPSKSYWLDMSEAVYPMVLSGVPVEDAIPLAEGWNLVGFNHLTEMALMDGLASIDGFYNSVWGRDATANWEKYIVDGSPYLNNMLAFKPGRGYWIDAKAGCPPWDVNGGVVAAPSSLPITIKTRQIGVSVSVPELPYTIWGNVEANGVKMADGATIFLKVDGKTQASYRLGARAGYGDLYVLDIPANAISPEARLRVQIDDTVIEAASLPPGNPGQIIHLDLSVDMTPEFSMLHQNYPNPFNPETWIPYQLEEGANVVISIHNLTGQLVRVLNLGHRPGGFYTDKTRAAYWDGRNAVGEHVASGVYFYTIQAGKFAATLKTIVAK